MDEAMDAILCLHFGQCGGCTLQDLSYTDQLGRKTEQLRSILDERGGVLPAAFGAALQARPWAYRHRARLTVWQQDSGEIQIGFRHRHKKRVLVDMVECPVLPARFTQLLTPLKELLAELSEQRAVSQLELAATEQELALVFRVMKTLSSADIERLLEFERCHGLRIYLQRGNMESIELLNAEQKNLLEYQLSSGIGLRFHPMDFTQVNPAVNRLLVEHVIEELRPKDGDKIADLFCGIGNFSLPLAQQGGHVTGMEFAANQVERATENAQHNQLSHRVEFVRRDLSKASQALGNELALFDKILLDPPRSGAPAVVASLKKERPRQIVYVSCNPETLAQDAHMLVNKHGFHFRKCTLVDMFPHTDHMESVSVFERG